MKHRQTWHWGAAAAATFCVLLWGAVPLITKVAVAEIPGDLVGGLRTIICLPVVLLLLATTVEAPVQQVRDNAAALAVMGAISFLAFPILFSLGQGMTTASRGGLILASAPVLTGIVSAIWTRVRPGVAWMVGAVLGFSGVAGLIVLRGEPGSLASGSMTGDLLVLAGITAASIGYVAGARLSAKVGAKPATYGAIAAAGILLLPWVGWQLSTFEVTAIGWQAWAAVLYLALIAQLLNYVLWYWALDRGGIARIAAFQFFQPVVTLILAVLFLGEVITTELALATAVILAGIGLCQFKRA